jgi:bifunctional DNase/RNase
LEHVRIHRLDGNTYHAVARLRAGDRVQEVDARPSDAVALAALLGRPIYVIPELMHRHAEPLNDRGELTMPRAGFESLREMWAAPEQEGQE